MALYVDNAISWAQFRLRGGFKNLLLTSIAYTLVAVFFIELFYQLADRPGEKMQLLEVASLIDLIFQCAFLLILCGNIVAGSLRRDITNHLIESHRLMPLSPVQAIVGYLAGTTVQILTLCAINFAIGADPLQGSRSAGSILAHLQRAAAWILAVDLDGNGRIGIHLAGRGRVDGRAGHGHRVFRRLYFRHRAGPAGLLLADARPHDLRFRRPTTAHHRHRRGPRGTGTGGDPLHPRRGQKIRRCRRHRAHPRPGPGGVGNLGRAVVVWNLRLP